MPLVADGPQAVRVGQRVRCGQDLVPGSDPGQGHFANGSAIHPDLAFQCILIPNRAAIEAHFRQSAVVEIAEDRDAIAYVADRQRQSVVAAVDIDVRLGHAGLEAQDVALADILVPTVDRVLPVAAAEKVGVVAIAAVQVVVPRPAIEQVIAGKSEQRVVAGEAG